MATQHGGKTRRRVGGETLAAQQIGGQQAIAAVIAPQGGDLDRGEDDSRRAREEQPRGVISIRKPVR